MYDQSVTIGKGASVLSNENLNVLNEGCFDTQWALFPSHYSTLIKEAGSDGG